MGKVTVQSHNVGLTSYRLISLWFHVNRPSHSWEIAFSKFDHKDQGSRSNDPGVAQLQVYTIPIELRMVQIHPAVSEVYDPICGKFDKFLAHEQAHMGQMGKWPWQCTTTGLDNSTELRTENIRQAVTEIWVPQVWQPPARTVTTIPLQPGGLRDKKSMVRVTGL